MVRQPLQSGPRPAAGTSLATLGPLSVSQVTRMVRDALRGVLPPVISVVGQISNWRAQPSGHAWFTLKDAKAQLSCVMWADRARRLKFQPADGLEIVASGSIDVYEPQGRYQLYVERLAPVGVGALEIAFRQLYEKLLQEGLFEQARKRRLPRFPAAIAIVTSPTGAAVRDILRTIQGRWPAVTLIVVPARVQGDKAADEIAAAIALVNKARERFGIHLLILGRGGGSLEDLWPFNEEIVARAIHTSGVPVISAVGHERDTTIADLVADVRASTPTHAGQLAVPALDEVLVELADATARLTRRIAERLEASQLRLESIEQRPWLADPVRQLRQYSQALDGLAWQARTAIQRQLGEVIGGLTGLHLRMQRSRPDVLLARQGTHLQNSTQRLDRAFQANGRLRTARLESLADALRQLSPLREIDGHTRQLGRTAPSLATVMRRLLTGAAAQLGDLEARLEASSPRQILGRGYTITRQAGTGRLIRAAEQVRPGMAVRTQTASGEFHSIVEPAPPPRSAPRKRESAGQLFLPIEPADT